MKKILILANNSGGLYNFRLELIQKLIDEGFRVYFTVPQLINDEKAKLIINTGGTYIHVPMDRRGINPLKDLKLIINYSKIIKNVNPDIILTYTIKPNIYGNYVANRFNIPVITNITGMGTSLITGKLRAIMKQLYKYGCGKANIVYFQNKSNMVFFIANNMVDKHKTKLIPGSGVNIDKFVPLKRLNGYDKIRFLFIGRLMKDKGINEYMEVAERLSKRYSNLEFQVLGSYEEEKYKEIIDNNMDIRYLGRSNDVRNEIRRVDAIVHPSYHEGMSNVLLESGAMGKPLLASNIPGCKEVIDDGENGFLFDAKSADSLENAIIKFINLSDKERQEMGKRSRDKIIKEFDRRIVVDEYIKTISFILGEGAK